MSALLAALYALCILFLIGFALFVFVRNPRSNLHRYFALLALALLGWVASLFAFDLQITGHALLWLGRFNFASIVFAVTLGYLFVREVAGKSNSSTVTWLWAETTLLGALTLLTPLIDRQELVQMDEHITVYGPLFVPYVLHVLILLGAMLSVAFRPRRGMLEQMARQLRLIGVGIIATATVALIANVVLPYGFSNFRFIHVGTVSTILFLGAVGYAVFAYHLFSIHVIIRATFVFAGLVALALELYSLTLSFLARLLPLGSTDERHYAATALVLVVNAFTQEPVRRWLEHMIDHTLRTPRTKALSQPEQWLKRRYDPALDNPPAARYNSMSETQHKL